MASPLDYGQRTNTCDGMCALVSDVLTAASAEEDAENAILYEALGRPLVMLALVGGSDGNRMVVGLAFNPFEFTRPLAQGRLTDKEWQANIYVQEPQLPDRPAWNPPTMK